MNSIKRGEIYMAYLETVTGSVQHGYRPVVVIQNNVGNRHSPTTIVVPVTSKKENKYYLPTHVRVSNLKIFDYNSVIECEQILTISKSLLGKKIGTLQRRKMIDVNIAIAVSILPGFVGTMCQMYKRKNRTIVEKVKLG